MRALELSVAFVAKCLDSIGDDSIYHMKHPAATAETYEYGRDVALGFFLAGKKTTKANGATR